MIPAITMLKSGLNGPLKGIIALLKDDDGNIVELHCSYDKETKGGRSSDGRKVKGTIHWVSAKHCFPAEVRLYDRLFSSISPDSETDYLDSINTDSLEILTNCLVEPDLQNLSTDIPVQFERIGYFFKDSDSNRNSLIFNRTVALRDNWSK